MIKKILPIIAVVVGLLAFMEDGIDGLIPYILLIGGGYLIYRGIFSRKKKKTEETPFLTKEKETYYKNLGMSESEINLFRDTMNSSKKQILQLQKNIANNAKLKAIDLRHDCLKTSKALFKELTKEPTRLPEASQFLYTHLPNLVDLTNHFVEINEHQVKSKEVYGKLEESSRIIDQMAALIVKDYQHFVSNDLEDLDADMNLAKEHIENDPDFQTK